MWIADFLFAKFPKSFKFSFCSAINPILYNALSTKFRRAFRRTLQCGDVRGSAGGGTGLPTPSLTYLANTRLSTVSMMQAGDTFNMHRSVRQSGAHQLYCWLFRIWVLIFDLHLHEMHERHTNFQTQFRVSLWRRGFLTSDSQEQLGHNH